MFLNISANSIYVTVKLMLWSAMSTSEKTQTPLQTLVQTPDFSI